MLYVPLCQESKKEMTQRMDLFTGFFYLGATQVGRVKGAEWVECRHLSTNPAFLGGNSNCFSICVGTGRSTRIILRRLKRAMTDLSVVICPVNVTTPAVEMERYEAWRAIICSLES